MRVAYIPSENMRPRIRAFAFPIRKRTFQPGIYCTARRAKGFECGKINTRIEPEAGGASAFVASCNAGQRRGTREANRPRAERGQRGLNRHMPEPKRRKTERKGEREHSRECFFYAILQSFVDKIDFLFAYMK